MAKYPDARTRIIRGSGPRVVPGEFKDTIRHAGMTPVRTAPYYPQSAVSSAVHSIETRSGSAMDSC